MLLEVGVSVSVCLVGLYVWLTWNYNHWRKLDIPYVEPNLIFGNIKDYLLMKKFKGMVYHDLYWQSEEPAVGVFCMRQPQLLIRDAEFAKMIFTTYFPNFQDNDFYVEPSDFFHSTHTFFLGGNKWKKMRSAASTPLSSGKIKMYIPHIISCCREMVQYLKENTDKEFEGKYFSGLYTTDVVMGAVYGVNSDSFRDPDSKYRKAIDKILNPGLWSFAKFTLATTFHSVGHLFKIGPTPKSFLDFYTGVIREAIDYRKSNNVKRNDFLQHLIDANGKDGSPELSPLDMMGVTMNVIMDASETVSSATSLHLEVLLRYPEVQARLREEIEKKIKSIDDMTYENINAIPYLHAFILEVLRLRTLLPLTERFCTNDCEISYGGKNYKFTKGDKLAISSFSIHMDPKYFPNPEDFRPERFLEKDEKDYLGYMPFGLGPRQCLGKLLGTLQLKVFLCGILLNFDILPSRELTPKVEYDVKSLFILSINNGVWFKVKERKVNL